MLLPLAPALDLTPPPFEDGLCDWSRGDGTPDSPTYETGDAARIARGDTDFGTCLELHKIEPVARLRYMGEMPLRRGYCVELIVRLKALRGPIPSVRLAAHAGGLGGEALPHLACHGPLAVLGTHGAVRELRLVIGRKPEPGVDLVWDARAIYGHVGLDLLGPTGGTVRIADLAVREIVLGPPDPLPGFEPAEGESLR